MNLSVVIIDDEPHAINVLRHFLKGLTSTSIQVAGTASNLAEGVELIRNVKPDLVFLDIGMPRQMGIEIYKYIDSQDVKVIFVTAHKDFAIEAIRNSAIDYLLKPVNIDDLRESIKKVVRIIRREQKQKELEDKLQLVSPVSMEGRNLLLETENGFEMENTRNIEYCMASQSYSVIVDFLGNQKIVTKPLKHLEELLPPGQFYRTHKSYLVNIFYVRRYLKTGSCHLVMKSGTKIPVSARKSSVITKEIRNILAK